MMTTRDIRFGCVAALLAAALLALAYLRAWPLAVDIGAGDARFVRGVHAPEPFAGDIARWTNGAAQIALPGPPAGSPPILGLRLLNARPAGQPAPVVTVTGGGRTLARFPVEGGPRRYRLLATGGGLGWAARYGILSDTIIPPGDPRPLGVVLDGATLAPAGPALPAPWVLLWGALFGAFGYLLARGIGLRPGVGVSLTVGLAAALTLAAVLRPPEMLPFVPRLAGLLAVGAGGAWLARLLAPPLAQGGVPWVRGDDLPVYLGVAWWLGPAFQLVMTADGAAGVTPAPATLWIGGALSLGLLLAAAWARGRPEGRRAAFARAALWLLAAAAVAHLGFMLWFSFQRQGPDFWILFKGAREWARGGSLYDVNAVLTNHFGHVFKVPPFYGMLFTPFVFQDGERLLFFHRALNVLLLLAAALAWYRMWGIRLASAMGAGVFILLNFRPMADTIAFGQVDILLLLLLTLALWALRGGRDGGAGALAALGALFKIYPVLLLAFFVAKRRWRGLAGFAIGMLVCNGLALAVMGWEMHRIYLTQVLPNIGGTTPWVENQTISAFFARLAAPPTDGEIFRGRSLALLGTLVSGLAGLLGCALALPPAAPRSTAFALQYGQFLLLMVLVVPAAWMHYETLLFVPFAALLLHLRPGGTSLPRAAALAAAFALIGYGNQWSFYDGTLMGVLTVAGVSYKFYGMLLLGGVIVAELLPGVVWLVDERRRTQDGSQPHIIRGSSNG